MFGNTPQRRLTIQSVVFDRLGHSKGTVKGDAQKPLNKAYTLLLEAIPETNK